MLYNNMLLSDHTVIFPAYLDKAARMALRERMLAEKLTISCGCAVFSEAKLPYTISADGRFIPLHQGYEHSPLCARGNTGGKRKSSYQASDDGTAKAFLDFDIRSFKVPKVKDEETDKEDAAPPTPAPDEETEVKEEKSKAPTEKKEKKPKEEKEPLDSLSQFILNLNNDTYKERITAGKGLLSADYFLPAVKARLKKVYIAGTEKPLKELSLESDYMSFFYEPLVDIQTSERNAIILKGWKNNYSLFLFEGTLKKELQLFEKRYGISVQEALQKYNVMAAGFIYLQISRKNKIYKVVGRLHIFVVNDNGLYCRDIEELEELNNISAFMRENFRYKTTQFHRIIDDPRMFGIIAKKGKRQILLCKPGIPKSIKPEGPDHIAFGTKQLTKEDLTLIGEIID